MASLWGSGVIVESEIGEVGKEERTVGGGKWTTGLREMNNVFCLEKFGGKMVVARPFVVGLNIVF